MPEVAQEKVEKILDQIQKLPGYIFELTADLGSGRNFSIRGNFQPDVPLETLNKELDKLVRATDRQLSKACIPNLEDAIEKLKQQLIQMENNVILVKEKTKNYASLPPAAKAEQENARTNVEALKAEIARKQIFLEKTRKDAE